MKQNLNRLLKVEEAIPKRFDKSKNADASKWEKNVWYFPKWNEQQPNASGAYYSNKIDKMKLNRYPA